MPMPLGRCAAVCSRRNGLLAVLTISTIIMLLALPCTLALSRHLVEKTPSSLPTLSSSQQQQQQQPSSPIDALQQYVDQDDGYYHYEHLADHTMSGRDILSGVKWQGYVLNMTSQKWLTDADVSQSVTKARRGHLARPHPLVGALFVTGPLGSMASLNSRRRFRSCPTRTHSPTTATVSSATAR